MNPQEQFCPNPDCAASGREGQIAIHSQKEQRYRCKQCGRTFTQTTGTAFFGLKKPHEMFVIVVTLLAYGCPVQAIVVAFGLDERTVWNWLMRSGQQAYKVHEHLILQGELDLQQIQADELKVKTYQGVLWLGLVMMVSTRLWLGGAVDPKRGKKVLRATLSYAQQSGIARRVLIAVDGFNIYMEVIPQVFGKTWDWLKASWSGWQEVAVVQTMKQRRGKLGQVHRQITWGTPQLVRHLIRASQKQGWINTAYIERLNATFRLRLFCLVRCGRALIRQPQTLTDWMWLAGSVYNFCTYHESLRLALPVSQRRRYWMRRTPAMAAYLTDHCWSVSELMWFKHPPLGWVLSRKTQGAFPLPRSHA